MLRRAAGLSASASRAVSTRSKLKADTWASHLKSLSASQRQVYESLVKTDGFIDGKFVKADGGKTFDVNDPATGEVIAQVADMGRSETQHAIAAAEAALPGWRAHTGKERSIIMRKYYDLLVEHKEALAHIMTAECGKPLAESLGEMAYSSSFIEWFSEEAKRAYGLTIPQTGRGKRIVVSKEPIGVCALITPWNFPSAMLTRKIGAALAAGCTVVAKPGADTPLSALALGVLAQKAGVPKGVVNFVTSSHENSKIVGKEMCDSEIVRKLSFTGSTPTGKQLVRDCAGTMKRLSMELGGNAPFIVFDDADIDAAVEGAMASKFRNAGQTCVCANRIMVQSKVYDEFAEKLAKKVKALKVGHGFHDGVKVGPLINAKAVEKSERLVKEAVKKGATMLTGGKKEVLEGVDGAAQNFFAPTVLTGVTGSMTIAEEEIFGPVASLIKFSTEEEAIAQANNTRAGLAAYFYSSNTARCWRVAGALEYGMVGINDGLISTEVAPFGGVKESGMGREGSVYGIDEYMELKYMSFGGIGS